MLVLSCKVGQRIVIPGLETEIAVIAIKGKSVRIGISAPDNVAVHREEVSRRLAELQVKEPET
jgi:carbon storage regulator